MGDSIEVPEFVLTKLRCKLCNGYLSVPPISGKQGNYRCGRCAPAKETNDLFEEVAKFIVFPCSNGACQQKLKWGDVQRHEKQCFYKPMDCPFVDCLEKYPVTSVIGHFARFHEDYNHYENLISQSVRMKDIADCCYYVHTLTYKATSFLIFVKINSEFEGSNLRYVYSVAVFTLSTNDTTWNYEVTLQLSSATEDMTLVKNAPTVPFDGETHCILCAKNECYHRDHVNPVNFFNTKFTSLDHKNNMHISYIVKVRELKSCSSSVSQTLECPICNFYMCKPIYNCLQGHSMCGACRMRMNICPYCKCEMGKARNYALEGIADTMQLPCHNAERGCKQVGLAAVMNNHTESCSF